MYAFAVLSHPVNVDEEIINDCSALTGVLKSKTVSDVRFLPELGRLEISRPFEFVPRISQIEDDNMIEEAFKRLDILSGIEEADVFVDTQDEEHQMVSFYAQNDELKDMLYQLGKADFIEITTGDKLKIKSSRKAVIKHPGIRTADEVSVVITEYAQPLLLSSLIDSVVKRPVAPSEEQTPTPPAQSKIYIIDRAFMVVKNACTTIVNARVEMR